MRKWTALLFFACIVLIILWGCISSKPLPQYTSQNYEEYPFPQPFEKNKNQTYEQNYAENRSQNKSGYSYQSNPGGISPLDLPSCGSSNELFSISPIALDQFISITPMGHFNPPSHTFPTDRIYFYLLRNGTSRTEGALAPAAEIPVMAPANITIFSIDAVHYSGSAENVFIPHTDYGLQFSTCKEFYGLFGHMGSISEKIKREFNPPFDWCRNSSTGGTDISACSKKVNIQIPAGEIIGTVGGPLGTNNLDFRVFDIRINNSFVNPKRWSYNVLHTVCPLDYFAKPLADTLYSKVSNINGKRRIVEPICGQINQDISNTAQGNWILSSISSIVGSDDPNIALAHDNIDPNKGVFSIGISMKDKALKSGLYYFDPSNSGFVNRNFDQVTSDGNIYCYETKFGTEARIPTSIDPSPTVVIIVKMPNNITLQIERLNVNNCGSGPWSFSNYGEYYR